MKNYLPLRILKNGASILPVFLINNSCLMSCTYFALIIIYSLFALKIYKMFASIEFPVQLFRDVARQFQLRVVQEVLRIDQEGENSSVEKQNVENDSQEQEEDLTSQNKHQTLKFFWGYSLCIMPLMFTVPSLYLRRKWQPIIPSVSTQIPFHFQWYQSGFQRLKLQNSSYGFEVLYFF
ncbi:hypothetical protein ABPG72_003260 [Tetrahymena utriculariae]